MRGEQPPTYKDLFVITTGMVLVGGWIFLCLRYPMLLVATFAGLWLLLGFLAWKENRK